MQNNEKLSLIEFLKAMISIVQKPKCKILFIKNLLELFGNIDVDGNLILDWRELLVYILENRQFLDERLVEGISEEDKLEIFHSHKSDFNVRMAKRKKLFNGRTSGPVKAHFSDDADGRILLLLNTKTCGLEVFQNSFVNPTSFE